MSESTETALKAILSGKSPAPVPSRRAFPRYSASYPILVEQDGPGSGSTDGVTINIARSGMLAKVADPVSSGTGCEITFLPRTRYEPELIECPHCGSHFPTLDVPEEPIHGTVVRVERKEESGYVVAIMFDAPLDAVGESDTESAAG